MSRAAIHMISRSRSRSPSLESNTEIDSLRRDHQHNAPSDGPKPLESSNESGISPGVQSDSRMNLTFDTPLPSTISDNLNLNNYDSPFRWSRNRKNICLILSCAATWAAAYSAGSYSIASGPLTAKFNISTETFQTGVTTWCVGFAVSPMFLAPLSELNGRRPVLLFSGFMFFVAQIGCALTNSFAGMLIARFFVGAGASTFATIIGGVVSDVYHAEERNTPMALYSASALAGTGFGPLLSGFIIGRTTWRWVFWHQVISLGMIMVAIAVLFKETRGSVLLSRKAKKINKYLDKLQHEQIGDCISSSEKTGPQSMDLNVRYEVAADASRKSLAHLLYLSLTTPFKLLVTEPVVFAFSLWAAFAWGCLYMQLNVLPLVFETNHNFNTQQQGSVFTTLIVGTLLAAALSIGQESIARKHFPKLLQAPEGRLYFACLEAALLPIGLFWFGWTSYSSIHWIVPCLGIGCAMMGIFSIYLAVFNYLADVYHRYASSALACQSFCRNILGAVFPLFSRILFTRLGFPAASSLLGGVAVLLTIVPWILVFKGETIRAKSKVASEVMKIYAAKEVPESQDFLQIFRGRYLLYTRITIVLETLHTYLRRVMSSPATLRTTDSTSDPELQINGGASELRTAERSAQGTITLRHDATAHSPSVRAPVAHGISAKPRKPLITLSKHAGKSVKRITAKQHIDKDKCEDMDEGDISDEEFTLVEHDDAEALITYDNQGLPVEYAYGSTPPNATMYKDFAWKSLQTVLATCDSTWYDQRAI
ncbi:hypothetical protein LTR05_000597 [Lithohypha guttulata]|uniref:Major facilitator superfamily (MFS) profile domain-containing protein n=1 Tax=Lithohypha guttulata TaxID=1690604 RepID=A0AAN7T6M1_9EURO|nr:hypothetical protein LTR05_000597 [Lithohypha guttulata]